MVKPKPPLPQKALIGPDRHIYKIKVEDGFNCTVIDEDGDGSLDKVITNANELTLSFNRFKTDYPRQARYIHQAVENYLYGFYGDGKVQKLSDEVENFAQELAADGKTTHNNSRTHTNRPRTSDRIKRTSGARPEAVPMTTHTLRAASAVDYHMDGTVDDSVEYIRFTTSSGVWTEISTYQQSTWNCEGAFICTASTTSATEVRLQVAGLTRHMVKRFNKKFRGLKDKTRVPPSEIKEDLVSHQRRKGPKGRPSKPAASPPTSVYTSMLGLLTFVL